LRSPLSLPWLVPPLRRYISMILDIRRSMVNAVDCELDELCRRRKLISMVKEVGLVKQKGGWGKALLFLPTDRVEKDLQFCSGIAETFANSTFDSFPGLALMIYCHNNPKTKPGLGYAGYSLFIAISYP
jgi:hypothetical protein